MSQRTSSLSARADLQAATCAAHLRLHRQPALAALAAGTIDRQAYRRLLERLYGFHLPLEARLIEASQRASFDVHMSERSRAHLLRQDLIDLGSAPALLSNLPSIDDLPLLDSCGKFLGCLYVREGATLGGRLLAKALDPLLGSAEPKGRRFLAGRADDPELWRNCCDALESAAAAGHLPDMRAGAERTFHAMELWLDGLNAASAR